MLQGFASVPSVCTQIARRLLREIDGVALHSYNGGDFQDPALREHCHVDHRAPVGIFYGFPNEIAEPFFRHPLRIGCFVCETDRIAPRWVEVCNALHLVVVPSTFCRQAFADSGVSAPILVVPHGLEPEYRPRCEKSRARPLVFYNTFFESSQLDRKSVEELVRSFLRAFGPDGEDCVLRLRTGLSAQLADIRSRHDFGRAIKLDLSLNRDVESFARIYSEVHCTVHPSKGEGFGLVPFQSIACETPVIAPPVTGMADYLDESNALCLRTGGRVRGRRVGNQAGTYHSIDEEHLVELLRHVHAHWGDEYRRVKAVAAAHRARFSWDATLSGLVEAVRWALESEPEAFTARLRRRLESPGPG